MEKNRSQVYLQVYHIDCTSIAAVTIAVSGTMECSMIAQLSGYYWLLKSVVLFGVSPSSPLPPIAATGTTTDVDADA